MRPFLGLVQAAWPVPDSGHRSSSEPADNSSILRTYQQSLPARRQRRKLTFRLVPVPLLKLTIKLLQNSYRLLLIICRHPVINQRPLRMHIHKQKWLVLSLLRSSLPHLRCFHHEFAISIQHRLAVLVKLGQEVASVVTTGDTRYALTHLAGELFVEKSVYLRPEESQVLAMISHPVDLFTCVGFVRMRPGAIAL
jgi:hypothetical protein